MLIGLFVIALVVTCAPIAAAVVVSVASRREDADCTLGAGPAPGPLRGLARQIVDFSSEVPEYPRPKNYGRFRTRRYAPRQTRLTEPVRRIGDATLSPSDRASARSTADRR
jgi:hypothetical protein